MFIGERKLLSKRDGRAQSEWLRNPCHRGSFLEQRHEMCTKWDKLRSTNKIVSVDT